MLTESFEHAEADFNARLLIDARNEAESVITATEKSLRAPEFERVAAEEMRPGEHEAITSAVTALKRAMSGSDREAIHQKTHDLNHATHHLAEVMMNRSVRTALAGKSVNEV